MGRGNTGVNESGRAGESPRGRVREAILLRACGQLLQAAGEAFVE